MKWISVKDKLPQEEEWVLVLGEVLLDTEIYMGCLVRVNGIWDWEEKSCCRQSLTFDSITHWMQLPEKPKE